MCAGHIEPEAHALSRVQPDRLISLGNHLSVGGFKVHIGGISKLLDDRNPAVKQALARVGQRHMFRTNAKINRPRNRTACHRQAPLIQSQFQPVCTVDRLCGQKIHRG